MEPTQQAQSQEQETPQISQEAIADDFQEVMADDYSYDGSEPEEPETVVEEQPQTTVDAEKNKPQEEQKQPQQNGSAGDTSGAQFDIDGFSKFVDVEVKLPPLSVEYEEKQQGTEQKIDDGIPEWQRPLIEERNYREGLQKRLTGVLDFYRQAREAGYAESDALAYANRQVNDMLETHLLERRAENEYKQRSEKEKADREAAENVTLKPKSDAVIASVANEFGGAEKMRQLLLTPELGGNFLLRLYARENQGKKYKSNEEYVKSVDSWFLRFTSDANNVRWAASQALANYTHRHRKDLVGYVQKNIATNNLASKSAQLSGVTKSASAPRPKHDELDMFLAPSGMREQMRKELTI